jgi:hypothetical protein
LQAPSRCPTPRSTVVPLRPPPRGAYFTSSAAVNAPSSTAARTTAGVDGGSERREGWQRNRVAFSCCGCGRFRGYSGVDCCCLGGGRRRSMVRVPFQ